MPDVTKDKIAAAMLDAWEQEHGEKATTSVIASIAIMAQAVRELLDTTQAIMVE